MRSGEGHVDHMNKPRNQHQEPSIEEVLASIRRVVTADREQIFGPDGESEAVMVSDKNEILNLKPMPKFSTDAAAPDTRSDEYPSQTESATDFDHQPATSRLASVLDPAVDNFMSSASIGPMLREWLDQNLPDMVEDRLKGLIRPLLKDWFDTNLPTMVDRIVRDEVERIVSANRN